VLVVEDGSGLVNAESYLSVADATAYHVKFGNAWSDPDTAKLESSLRAATQYIDSAYRFRGCRLNPLQALQFPRDARTMWSLYGAIGIETWPVPRLQQACAELAMRALNSKLYTDQADTAVTSETVGPISVTYASAQNGGQVRYAVVDDLLAPFTGGGRLSVRVERA
jgi:hypothetical protein